MKKKILSLLCGCMLMSLLGACGQTDTNTDDVAESVTENTQEDTLQENVSAEEAEPLVLSDDLYSYQVSVNGTVYQFPMWYKELEELGWKCLKDSQEKLDSGISTKYSNIWKIGDDSISTVFSNLSKNTAPYSECEVTTITFNIDWLREGEWEIILPGGIQLGVSTKEDIFAAYGEPTRQNDIGSTYSFYYTEDYYHDINLQVDKESGVLCDISITSYEELEGGDNSISTEVPESVKNYVAPTELGNNLYGMNFELDGHLYTLPCPVAEFVANGFEVDMEDERTDKELVSGDFGMAFFKYKDQTVGMSISNYSPNATTPDNCFVTRVESYSDSLHFQMVIPHGIKIGSTAAEVEAALANYKYEVNSVGDTNIFYTIYNPNADFKEYWSIGVTDGFVSSFQANTYVRVEY